MTDRTKERNEEALMLKEQEARNGCHAANPEDATRFPSITFSIHPRSISSCDRFLPHENQSARIAHSGISVYVIGV